MDFTSSIAMRAYQTARHAAKPEPQSAPTPGLAGLATDFAATVQKAETTAQAALTGKADSHALVQAIAASELAVETTVTLRDKVVEAYQEILRMPI